jgi:hypothetical protein
MTDMQANLPLLIVQSSILNLVINFSRHLDQWNKMPYRLYLCLAHSITSPPMSMQHIHQHDQQWYDPLHIIMWSYWFINLEFSCSSLLCRPIGAKSCSSFTITRGPSLRSLRLALHTCNRSIEPSLDLLHLDHMTQCHVSCAMSSFINTCISIATSPSHLYHRGICCLHTCTCGLISCVSHINTISPPKVVTQLPKPNKDLLIWELEKSAWLVWSWPSAGQTARPTDNVIWLWLKIAIG